MVSHHRTEGFIFKAEDRLELDRVFSIFTREFGRVEIFGKSIRKIDSKLRGGMEIFSRSEIEFIQSRHRKTLIETFCLERFKQVKSDAHAFFIARHISDLLDHFLQGEEKDETLWDLVDDVFLKLNQRSLPSQQQTLLYYYFLWNLVTILGYKPELSQCVICGENLMPPTLYFSFGGGGMLCQRCFSLKKDGIRVRSETITIIRLFVKKEWGILSRLKIDSQTKNNLQIVSRRYILYLLHQGFLASNSSKEIHHT